jgi:hypothetical protein
MCLDKLKELHLYNQRSFTYSGTKWWNYLLAIVIGAVAVISVIWILTFVFAWAWNVFVVYVFHVTIITQTHALAAITLLAFMRPNISVNRAKKD